jgi:copper homeostasis protein
MPDESNVLLEVIACSVAEAVEAAKGGASRLEIVRDLRRGGLTPPFELVQQIKDSVDLPLRVMVRESDGYETQDATEIDRLCHAAQRFASIGVDGLVLGFLKGGNVEVELTQRVLACAPNLRATFHHAFEDAKDKSLALSDMKRIPQLDRILSHGGTDEIEQRVQRLREYERAAAPELTILAGGGIDGDAILKIGAETGIREFHVGRAARSNFQIDGDVQSSLVSALVKKLREI